MTYYAAPFTFDFATSKIEVDVNVASLDPLNPFYDVDCTALYQAIKLAQASEEGILYGRIAEGSGLKELGPQVAVGLTVELLGSWQLRFPSANYIARVAAGNLVGGPAEGPVEPSPVVRTVIVLSANSTVVDMQDGVPTAAQNAAAVLAAAQITPIHADIRKVNNITVDGAGTEADPFGPA